MSFTITDNSSIGNIKNTLLLIFEENGFSINQEKTDRANDPLNSALEERSLYLEKKIIILKKEIIITAFIREVTMSRTDSGYCEIFEELYLNINTNPHSLHSTGADLYRFHYGNPANQHNINTILESLPIFDTRIINEGIVYNILLENVKHINYSKSKYYSDQCKTVICIYSSLENIRENIIIPKSRLQIHHKNGICSDELSQYCKKFKLKINPKLINPKH